MIKNKTQLLQFKIVFIVNVVKIIINLRFFYPSSNVLLVLCLLQSKESRKQEECDDMDRWEKNSLNLSCFSVPGTSVRENVTEVIQRYNTQAVDKRQTPG